MKRLSFAAAALAGLAVAPALGQSFAIEGAVLDTRNARNLGVTSERGAIADLFKAQKAVTFGILRAAGVDLDRLPPDVRARISRFQTTNVDAFRAFSLGLDLKDQGRFVEAKEAFRRAAELDPNFQLAADQQRAMPEVNLGGAVQTRVVIAAAANTAVERGKQGYVVDLARAMAALQSGQSVSVTTQPAPQETVQGATSANDYTSNPAGSGAQFQPNIVAGLSYSYDTAAGTISIANTNEWTGSKYTATNTGVLQTVGAAGDFQAQLLGGRNVPGGSVALADGTQAYWGSWLSTPGASAFVTVNNSPVVAPVLGTVDYAFAEATTVMPSAGTASFRPLGGSLQNVTGTIDVKFFGAREVSVNNVGFTIGTLAFSGLNGTTTPISTSGSGAFRGNYSSGSCSGCAAFVPGSSSFGGNFVGKDASGLIFSTILLTGTSTASGVHVFGK